MAIKNMEGGFGFGFNLPQQAARPLGWYPPKFTIITPPKDKQLSEENIWWLFFVTSWDAPQKIEREENSLHGLCD